MFCKSAGCLDDLMRDVFSELLNGSGTFSVTSQKGSSTELFGSLLTLDNPRARLSRSIVRARPFSSLGELTWYLSGSNDIEHIEYYIPGYREFSDDGVTAYGAYGPRIFGMNTLGKRNLVSGSQWDRVTSLLSNSDRSGSRNAVISIISDSDFSVKTKDRPCTCALQFAIRDNKLLLHTHMRSNDAYLGLPHDLFSFTMLQEIAAREIGVELGDYSHSVGSLHLYSDNDSDFDPKPTTLAQQYLDEGYQSPTPMPEMPKGDPWPSIEQFLIAEREFRKKQNLSYSPPPDLSPYWQDLITLLRAYGNIKNPDQENRNRALDQLIRDLNYNAFRVYLQDRIRVINE